MGDQVTAIANSYLDAVHGAAIDHRGKVMIGYNAGAAPYPYITGWFPNGTEPVAHFAINITDVPNRAPVLTIPASKIPASAGQTLQVSGMIGASDADNDALTYYFYDNSAAANSGHFVLNGTPVGQGAVRQPLLRAMAA